MSDPTEDSIDFVEDRWQLMVSALIGLTAGFLGYLIHEFESADPLDRSALALFVGFAGVIPLVALRRQTVVRDLLFGGVVAVLVAGLFKLAVWGIGLTSSGAGGFFTAFTLSAIALLVAPVVFYQTGRDAGGFRFPYRQLFLHAWQNKLVVLTAGFFLGCCWLVLALWGALFKLVKIDFFADLFTDTVFILTFSGLAFGLGVAIARQRQSIIEALRRIILALFRFITPVLGFVILAFVLVLPFTGLEPLWETKFAAGLIIVAIYLYIFALNVVIQTGEEPERLWPPAEWLVMAACLALPIFAAIGFYGLYLRIEQYGWTPDRFYALCLMSIGGIYAVAYAGSILFRRRAWMRAVCQLNPPLALAVLAIAILIHIPGLDPFNWSTRQQMARLLDGRADASEFDYAFLRFRLGEPGRTAFAALAAHTTVTSDAQAKKTYERAVQLKFYRSPKRLGDPTDTELLTADYVVVRPAEAAFPDTLKETWINKRRYVLASCFRRNAEPRPNCVLLRVDVNGDGLADAVFFGISGHPDLWIQGPDGDWGQGPTFSRAADNTAKLNTDERLQRLADGDFKLVPSRNSDLIVGGMRFE